MNQITKEQQKEFALSKIAPYFKNPELCGYDGIQCNYYTEDGKVCVAGACMIDPKAFQDYTQGIVSILMEIGGEGVFKEDCRNKLDSTQWQYLQCLHDSIATGYIEQLKTDIKNLKLFTYTQLKAYAKKI